MALIMLASIKGRIANFTISVAFCISVGHDSCGYGTKCNHYGSAVESENGGGDQGYLRALWSKAAFPGHQLPHAPCY